MPPRRPERPSRFRLIPPGASYEDDAQLEEIAWSLTVGEFVRLVHDRYGFIYQGTGGDAAMPYLRGLDGRIIEFPEGFAEDEPLSDLATASLCRKMGIPVEDFGLVPEEPYDDSCELAPES